MDPEVRRRALRVWARTIPPLALIISAGTILHRNFKGWGTVVSTALGLTALWGLFVVGTHIDRLNEGREGFDLRRATFAWALSVIFGSVFVALISLMIRR